MDRVYRYLMEDSRWDEQQRKKAHVESALVWLMERRLEQIGAMRAYVRHYCPTALADQIFRKSEQAIGMRNDAAWATGEPSTATVSRCVVNEHVYHVGEPKCDCGLIAVRTVKSTL
jgi:hypothetical protein